MNVNKKEKISWTILSFLYGFSGVILSFVSAVNSSWLGICIMMWAMFITTIIIYEHKHKDSEINRTGEKHD